MISTGLQQSLGIIYSNICRRVAMRLDYVLIMCTNFRLDCEHHWEGLRNHLKRKTISTLIPYTVCIYSRIMKIEMMVYMIRHAIQSNFQHCLVGLELLTRRLNTLVGSSAAPGKSVAILIFNHSGGIHSTLKSQHSTHTCPAF